MWYSGGETRGTGVLVDQVTKLTTGGPGTQSERYLHTYILHVNMRRFVSCWLFLSENHIFYGIFPVIYKCCNIKFLGKVVQRYAYDIMRQQMPEALQPEKEVR